MNQDEQPQENADEAAAQQAEQWEAHVAYCFGLAYHNRASGTGSGNHAQTYEHNGWLYGVADRPGYSDTPKDKK